MPKVGLVFPRTRYPSGDFPLGITLLAAYIRRELGYEVVVCDSTFDPRVSLFSEFYDREKPDIIGIGMSTLMLGEGITAARMAKERGLPVFVGGPHPTISPDEMMELDCVDAVVMGEGEVTVAELLPVMLSGDIRPVAGAKVKTADGTILVGPARAVIPDLSTLPFPAWDTIDMERYIGAWGQLDCHKPGLRGVNLVASRGCPFTCSFCQPVLDSLFGHKLRLSTPARVVDEILELKRQLNIEAFWFTDDTFTLNKKWVMEFCQILMDREVNMVWGCTTRANLIAPELMETMAAAGLRKIGIGMESATERIREGVYDKGITSGAIDATVHAARKWGVKVLLFLMLGAPSETRREMLETVEAATRLPAQEASFSIFVPIPGTTLHQNMVQQGYTMSSDYTDYDYYARRPFESDISRKELRMLQRWAYFRFYSHPYRWRSVARNASTLRGVLSMGRKALRLVPSGTSERLARDFGVSSTVSGSERSFRRGGSHRAAEGSPP